MSDQYYIRLAGVVRGPYSLTGLKDQIKRGVYSLKLSEVSLDRKHWKPATDFPELAEARTRRRRRKRTDPTTEQETSPAETFSLQPEADSSGSAVGLGATPDSDVRTDDDVSTSGNAPRTSPGVVPPPADNSLWYYTVDGKQESVPIERGQLVELIRGGTVSRNERIWCEGLPDWISVTRSEFASEIYHSGRENMSGLAALSAALGGAGYLLLMLCTVLLVLEMRRRHVTMSENLGVLAMVAIDFLIGIAALLLGHLAIQNFRRAPGSPRERYAIVIGLSCGYSAAVISAALGIAAAVSSAGASKEVACLLNVHDSLG